MANSYSVVSIDQAHFDNRLSSRRVSRNRLKKKLYTHTTKDALTPRQIDRLIQAAMTSPRNGPRDAALILLAYKHGFKVSELRNLKWEHINFENQSILVSRLSNGQETFHTLGQFELELLNKLQKQNTKLIFRTQSNNKLSSTHIRRIIKQAGVDAGFKQPVCPSMISGSSGFEFANAAEFTKH